MKISICIPTYNQAEFLEIAIRSALNQTIIPYEILVFDDCSTDETPNILISLSKEIAQLKYVRQPKNLGIAANTDQCLRAATGDFIIRLDSDDILASNYSEKLIKLLQLYPEAGYAHAAVYEIDQFGNIIKLRNLFRSSGYHDSSIALKAAAKGYRVAANIIMFKRAALVKVNFITGRPDYVEDFHLSASIAATGYGNAYLEEPLSFYRVWVDSGKVRQRRKILEINGLEKVFAEVLEPAFIKKGWSLNQLKKERSNFACTQADCLSWKVFSIKEKEELANALSKLSSSFKARCFFLIYLQNVGTIFRFYSNISTLFKSKLKRLIVN